MLAVDSRNASDILLGLVWNVQAASDDVDVFPELLNTAKYAKEKLGAELQKAVAEDEERRRKEEAARAKAAKKKGKGKGKKKKK